MVQERETAKIYVFPTRAHATRPIVRDEAKAPTPVSSERFADAGSSDSWYHEEAIREAERARKL